MTIPTRPSTMFTMQAMSGGEVIKIPNPDMDSGERIIGTIVNAGRNASAVTVAQKVGRDQGSPADLKWNVLSKEEWEMMVQFWDRNFYFNFTFYDDVSKTKITRECYIGDRVRRPFQVDINGVPVAYRDCSATVVDTGKGS